MVDLHDLQRRHIGLMRKTADTLGHILKNTTQEQATTLRDGPEGWTILEVVCHLRDFDVIFRERAQLMLTSDDTPRLPAYDHEQMAIDSDYNAQELAYCYDEFAASRKETVKFFLRLDDAGWQSDGVHPERGHFTMTDAVMQVSHHDMDHLEQITRLLEREKPGSGSLPSE